MKSIHPAKLIYQFLLFQTSWLPFAATTHSLVVKQEWFFICCQLFSGLWLSVLVVSVHSFQCKKKNPFSTTEVKPSIFTAFSSLEIKSYLLMNFRLSVLFFLQYKLEIYRCTIPTPTFSSVFIVCCTSVWAKGKSRPCNVERESSYCWKEGRKVFLVKQSCLRHKTISKTK